MGPMPMRFGPGGHGGPFLMVHRKLVVRNALAPRLGKFV